MFVRNHGYVREYNYHFIQWSSQCASYLTIHECAYAEIWLLFLVFPLIVLTDVAWLYCVCAPVFSHIQAFRQYTRLTATVLVYVHRFNFWQFVFVASIKFTWAQNHFLWIIRVNEYMCQWKSTKASGKMNWNWLLIKRFYISVESTVDTECIELTNQCSFSTFHLVFYREVEISNQLY